MVSPPWYTAPLDYRAASGAANAIIPTVPPFYTRLGDDGYTGLLGAGRVPKYAPRPEAYGSIDEASAALAVARSQAGSKDTRATLVAVQRDLYHVMAEVAAAPEQAERFRKIDESRIRWLEAETEGFAARVEVPKEFVVFGDAQAGAALDLARTIVRRAERRVAWLAHHGELSNPDLLRYLNRLSSLCFVLALWEDQQAGMAGPRLAKEGET
jgi:cob(I)alamin adenosyltransferase